MAITTGLQPGPHRSGGDSQMVEVTIDPTGISAHSSTASFPLHVASHRPLHEVMIEALAHIGIRRTQLVNEATNAPLYKLVADTDGDGTVDEDVTDMSKTLTDIGLGGVAVPTLQLADV